MATSVNTMKNFFDVLKEYSTDTVTSGIAILDDAVKETTRFSSLEDAVNNFLNDMEMVTKNFGVMQSLYQNCGISIADAEITTLQGGGISISVEENFSADTGAVTGYNAGNHVIKDAQSIVPEPAGAFLSDASLPAEGSSTIHTYTGANGSKFTFTITYPETYTTVRDNSTSPLNEDGQPDSSKAELVQLQPGKTYISEPDDDGDSYSATYDEAVDAIKTMMRGLENYWVTEGLKLAYDSFGLDFNGKNLQIDFGINQSSQAETGPTAEDPSRNGQNVLPQNIRMELNVAMYAKMDPDDPNGNTRVKDGAEQNYLDRTIAHELIHAVMQAGGTLKDDMPEFFTEGIAELVHGNDDYDSNNAADVIALAEDIERLDKALTFKAGTGTPDAYPAGDMFLRYLCKQSFAENYYLSEMIGPTTQVLTYNNNSILQEIEPPEYDNDQVIIMNEGNQNLTLDDGTDRVAVVGETSYGNKNIVFGSGNGFGLFTAPDSNVNVTIGTGKDTLLVDNQSKVNIDMSNSNDAKLILHSGKVTLEGYDAATHEEISLPNFANVAGYSVALVDNALQFSSSVTSAAIELNDSNFVDIITREGEKMFFGMDKGGGLLDGANIDRKQILFGGDDSTLRGGNRSDTIYAGNGDVVSLSGGHDKVYLADEKNFVDMGDGSVKSRTEIVSGLSLASDVIKINSPNDIKFRVFDDKLSFDNVNSRVTFDELGSFSSANGLQIQSGEEIYTLRSNYDSGLSNVDYLMQDDENRFFKVGTDFYIKDNGDNREYHLGDVGGTGKLTISDFNFGTDGDEIYLDSIDGLNGGGNDVYVVNGNNRVIVEGGAGKVMNINVAGHTYVAELGKELTYNDDVEYYGDLQGGTGCAISVGADYSGGEVAVYLNESTETNGKSKNYLGVNKVDASAYGGQASIIGGDLDDKIIGAQGNTSMWGGDSGDDILFGTGSDNTFFYFRGNGNDQIRNAADGDVVNLGDITLADIISTEVMGSGAKFDFNDGGSLTVLNAGDVTYKLGDGSSWKANYSSREWEQQA